MKRLIFPGIIFVLLMAIGGLSWQVNKLSGAVTNITQYIDSSYLTYYADAPEPFYEDLRGYYGLPTYGQFIFPQDSAVSLTMVVFLSAAQDCPLCINELATLQRLDSVFTARGQRMFAVSIPEDSVMIRALLEEQGLNVPLITFGDAESGNGFVFEQLGFSKFVTPVKVLFDKSMTAIYMRVTDNTPESQQAFQRAALNLSELAMDGKL